VERTTEPKIVLLVRLLNAIDEGRHSFEHLKDRIAEGNKRPSTRSLRRYLAVLAEAGFPWHFERTSNSYRFAGGYSLARLNLSGPELFGLVALKSFGASIGGNIGASIREITEKMVGDSRATTMATVSPRRITRSEDGSAVVEYRVNDVDEFVHYVSRYTGAQQKSAG
jgi:predicted DNA-binding transcriptional regulator YafY